MKYMREKLCDILLIFFTYLSLKYRNEVGFGILLTLKDMIHQNEENIDHHHSHPDLISRLFLALYLIV